MFTHRKLLRTEGNATQLKTAILPHAVFDNRTSFRAKRLQPTLQTRHLTSVFDDRTSFRAKGLHLVAPRWHCPAP